MEGAMTKILVKLTLPLVIALVLLLPAASGTRADPLPSEADAAYPLNHTFDAAGQPIGSPPPNSDFETPGYAIGSPPSNYDLEAPAVDAGTPPTNHDFETGDFTGWTTSGTTSIESDAEHGYYAKLGSSGTIISSPFTVDSTAQNFAFDIGYLSTSGYSWVKVYALSGPDYGTQTLLANLYCSSCGYWERSYADASQYLGQSIKLKFRRFMGNVGIDDVSAEITFPDFELEDTVKRMEEGGDTYARLDEGSLTSAPFTLDSEVQYVKVDIKGIDSLGRSQYKVYVLSGPGFETSTQAALGYADYGWQTVLANVSDWQGQQIKLKVAEVAYSIGTDDIGRQWVEVSEWDVTEDTRLEEGGPGGNYVSTNGKVTSSAFTLDPDVQQLSLRYSATEFTTFYVELLRGPDFSEVVDLAGYMSADETQWKSLKAGVSLYAGETVKLRVRRYFGGRLVLDDAGLPEITVPGWKLATNDAVATGEDSNGTYVTPFESDSAFFLDSVDISPGIIDRPGKVDQKYYAISYDIGYSTGNLMEVYWRNSSGEWWKLTQDAADTPTGYRTRHFYIADFMFQEGYFRVKLAGGGKVYSIADNVARQHMREPFSQKVGLSVDTSTGSFGFEDRDLTVEGRVPLVLTRYYSGHSDRFGPLGYRWTHSFDTHLEITTGDDAGVVFGSGGEEFFIWNPAYETFSPADARVHDELVKNEDDTYTLTTKENLDYNFDSDGKLTTIEDLDGNTVSLTYDGSDRLISVEDPDGRTLTFAYDGNGRLASVTDPTDAVVSYAYDANGDLTSVTDPEDGVRTYSYSKHRLTQVVDQNGKTLFTNTLDSVNRVVEQTDALGHTISISYDTPDKGVTQVVDPESNTAKYYYDAVHRTTAKVDPLGQVISYVYDSVGNLEKVIDPLFNEWEFAYDDSGNLTSSTDPLGNPIAITYNPQHLPTTITDARGNVTTLTYDDQGNLTSTTDPLDNVTTYTYDDDGNLTSMTNPLSETETYTYDAQGNRISRTDPLGHTWQWTYNAAGRMTSETDPLGNTTQYIYDLFGRITGIRNALGEETTFLYDLPGHLLMVEDPLGNRTLWAYDDRGLAVSKTDPADKITTYTYDANRNMTSVTDPLGNVTTYAYDENNRLESVTDPAGDTTSYTYDDAGRLASEEDPLGRITSYEYDDAGRLNEMTLPNDGIFTFEYDPDGNLISETDPLDHTTSYMYDEISRRTRVTDPLLNWTSYNYDDASRLIEVVNALGYTTSYGYDDAGRLTSITDPLDNVRSFGYDDAGNRTSSTDPVGRTTTFSYDELNRMASVTDPIGNTTTYTFDAAGRTTVVTRPSGNATTYAYDPRDLLTSVTDALLNVTTYAYDDAGRQISMTDPRGNVTSYGHDPTGRLTTITDALGGVVTFSYDDAGQQTEVTNPRGKTTIYTYDDLGNVLTETDPLERVQSYSYDDLGRLSQTTDARGVVVDYEYDELDRLISVTYPSGSVTYGYDDLGRRISMIDPTGTTTWGYDNASRVTSVASPQGTVDYEYNDAGQRTAMTLPGSRTVEYDYDDAGRLSALTDWQARTITSGYDPDGQRTSIARPNGIDTTYGYDDAGRLTSVIHSGSGGPIESFSYTLDENGNRVAVTSSAGTETYTLDALDRVTSVLYPNGDQVTYEYDDNGNRLTMTVNGVPTNYSYDDADQLLSDGSTTYTYDNNGNLIAAGTDTFTWDYADRLTSATVGGTCGSYSYDGDGTRVEKTVDEVDTSYLWDRQAGLPLLVDDETNAYLHADGALAELDGASQPTYLLDDALGSVRGLTDLGGSLTGTADYDVFGQVRAASGTSSAFGFTGEQFDAETGFTFLRARYLDPRLGRFLSADSIQPNAPGTQGYNLYTYVANNPTTWVDPSGQSILPAIVAAAIQSIRVFLATTPPIGWGLIVLIVAPPIICALDPDCSAEWWEYDKIIRHYGSKTWEGAEDLPVDMLLDAPNSFPLIPSPRRAAECLGDPSECARDALSCAGDPLGCSYPLRAPFTIALEQAFRRLSTGDAIPLEGGITLITNCRGLCELVQDDAFTIGHTIFTTLPAISDRLLRHEKRHVEQYEKMGDRFWSAWLLSGGVSVIGCLAVLPAGGDYYDCLHDTNILEILAR
jgi:RHS repeat-associated protein